MASRSERQQLDQFNDQLRNTPLWREFMQRQGYKLVSGEPIKLSDGQRKALQRQLEQAGIPFKGLEIDGAGNLNQPEGFGTEFKKWAPMVGQGLLALATGGMSIPAQLAINAGTGAAIGGAKGGVKGALIGAGTGAAAVGAGQAVRALAGGGGGGAGSAASQAAGDVLPSARVAGPLHRAVPGAIGSQGVSAGLAGALGAAGLGGASAAGPAAAAIGSGASGVSRVLDILGKAAPLALGGAAALGSAFQGRPPAEDRLNNILSMAEGRIRDQEPLFKAITTMANSQLPDYVKQGR